MVVPSETIDSLLKENEQYPPPDAFRRSAWVADERIYEVGARDPEAFWAAQAAELQWTRPWDKVLDWDPPFAKWFVGGKINVSENCLDRHVESTQRHKAAIVWEGEPGDKRVLTYDDLWRQVNRFSTASRSTCR